MKPPRLFNDKSYDSSFSNSVNDRYKDSNMCECSSFLESGFGGILNDSSDILKSSSSLDLDRTEDILPIESPSPKKKAEITTAIEKLNPLYSSNNS